MRVARISGKVTMQWNDKAIILSVRRLGESSGVINLLTESHGMYAGVDKGAFGKRKRGICQPGNIVVAHWQARLAEHLGMISCELTQATAAHLLDDRCKLAALTSATLLTEKMLAEREAQPAVYACMEALVSALCSSEDWLSDYVRLEFALLAHTGFGIDLERCAATGQAHDLLYVSPKSGRAVSRDAGAPYHGKLLPLPPFLLSEGQEEAVEHAQILDGLRLCGYFLGSRVFAPRGLPLPAVRARFVRLLQPEDSPIGEVAHQGG
jgi:DNA repair protein RecO (recombination protein O)